MQPQMALKEGKFVRVRGRRWVVQKIDAVPAEDTAVCLACVDDDAAGVLLDVLWERELDASILGEEGFGGAPVTHIDRPDLFAAYLDTLRWSGVTSTRADLFQSPYRAGIAVKAHQLEPLRKALLLPRANLLIADDVGLGKTIEAGLILREMILRQRVRRVVVACPPSVVLQWQAELERRFGLAFKVLDRAYVLRMRRDRGHAVNPWDTHHKLIISHALLREEAYAGPLRRTLELDRKGSLLILAAMVKKTGTIHKELGSVGTVINGKLTALLERGIPMSRAAELCSEIEQLAEEPSSLDARRVELEAPKSRAIIDAELAELRRLLEQSRVHLDFDADRLRFALDAALGLLGEAPLAAITHASSRGSTSRFLWP